LIYGGGAGVGKTSAVRKFPRMKEIELNSPVIWDGNSSSYASTVKRIDEALANGYRVEFVYIDRDIEDAFINGVLPRAVKTGRTVPIDIVIDTHIKSRQVAQKLLDEYSGRKGITINVIDNNQGMGGAIELTKQQANA